MNGSGWNWCDALSAIGSILMPIVTVMLANGWFKKKREEAFEAEQSANMNQDDQEHSDGADVLREFWGAVRNGIAGLGNKSLPTRRFWSLPFKKGVRLVFVISDAYARVELYIDNGDAEWNLNLYEQWKTRRKEIDSELGQLRSGRVIWYDRPQSRAKGIGVQWDKGGLKEKSKWMDIIDFYNDSVSAFNSIMR